MDATAGDEQGGAGDRGETIAIALHHTGAGHHHPVLAAVVVALQADALIRLDQDPLDEIAGARRQGFEPSPGTLDARRVESCQRAPLGGDVGWEKD